MTGRQTFFFLSFMYEHFQSLAWVFHSNEKGGFVYIHNIYFAHKEMQLNLYSHTVDPCGCTLIF